MEWLLIYFAEAALALLASVGLYCLYKWALVRWHSFLRTLSRFERTTLAVLIAAAIVATIEAQKSGGDRSGEEDSPAENAEVGRDDPIAPPRSGASEMTNLCFTGIYVSSNGMAQLSLAWPTNLLFAGDIVDLFAATSLVGTAWGWVTEHALTTDAETNWTEVVDTSAVAGVSRPPTMFFSASVRAAPDDLRDTDGDSIPDAYEVYNGTNPYASDYADAQKLTVGPSGLYADISSALAASTAYSIIELAATNMHVVGYMGARVPQHPVMICAPPGPPAVVRATGLSAFLFDASTTSHTLFKNLYVLLDATSGSQAGFWVGGNLPWYPIAASATFEDIYVRAPKPGVEHFGWLLYISAEEPVSLSRCTVNATGSEWVYGVQDFGTAPLLLEDCTFVNFPSNLTGRSCGILTRSSSNAGGGAEVSVSRTVFDESFINAIMIGRLEEGVSNVISVANCIVPRELSPVFPFEFVSGVVVTNAALAWSGFPTPDSPSVALGMGALAPFANDPATDTDGDGFCDYVEVYEKGTDPYLVDSDMDGVSDYDEDQQGTDPTNPHSFEQKLTVTVTNTVSLSHAAYLAWGYYETGWEANEVVMFPFGAGTNLYVNASSNGAEYVKAFCDLDDDGAFSTATDILIATKIPLSAVANVSFRFGDVDGDGVTDEQERFGDHTDPYDGGNFKLSGTKILYADLNYGQGITNLIEVSPFRDGWNPNNVATSFVSQTFAYNVDTIVTGGVVYVKCLRDLDGDGELDIGVEQIVVTKFTSASRGKTENAVVGDYDGDGIADTQELQDGTDPYDKNNYAVNLFGHFEGVFHTTNKLSVVLQTASETLYGPVSLTNGTTWTFASNHVEVTGGGRPYFVFWDDADSNEVHEAYEASVTYMPSPFSHDMVFTNRLSYGSFDKDNDGMIDWWELQHGLSPIDSADAFFDGDCDGLLNIHEFIHGFDPSLADATNTALAAFSSAVDERLLGKSPQQSLCKFVDYFENGSNLVFCTNVDFWAADVDTSCASMWNTPPQGTHAYGWHFAGTAISSRHVLFAHHFAPNNGTTLWFRGNDGNLYSDVLSNTTYAGPDIRVGVLVNNLPTNIIPAKILPENYSAYIGNGRFLPSVTFDQEEKLLVSDITSLQVFANRSVLSESGYPKSMIRSPFYENVIGGDSGNPRFLILGNHVVLLYTLWKGGGGSGCFITHYRQEIQNAMDRLCPGYVLQEVDLSPFDQLDSIGGR